MTVFPKGIAVRSVCPRSGSSDGATSVVAMSAVSVVSPRYVTKWMLANAGLLSTGTRRLEGMARSASTA